MEREEFSSKISEIIGLNKNLIFVAKIPFKNKFKLLSAGLLFLPSGLIIGACLFLSPTSADYLKFIRFYPLLVTILSAASVSALACYLKHRKKCLVFYHFYILMFSVFLMLISGFLIIFGDWSCEYIFFFIL